MAISPDIQAYLRQLPSVDELLNDPAVRSLGDRHPRWAVVEAVREVLAGYRHAALEGLAGAGEVGAPDLPRLRADVAQAAAAKARAALRRVVNATGVVLHTNLGRAPLAAEALARIQAVGSGYANLEYDLAAGGRGSRQAHVEGLLIRLAGAEAALVVNNNAAAVLLAINTLAEGKEVVVSRGQLVEIGDSFRIPDVMRKAGGILREVGTTNRTHLRDYEAAIGPATALLLKVHTSNFRVVGFTAEVGAADLVALGRRHGIPVMEDLGSGALVDLSAAGLRREPMVADSVRAGVDLVTFSGDKLLGAPQAGIVLGRRDLVLRLRRNPLARAVRIDKLSAAGLEATLRIYLEGDRALRDLPILRMLSLPAEAVAERARGVAAGLAPRLGSALRLEVVPGESEVGGGALPLQAIPTWLLALSSPDLSAEAMEARLRACDPPVLARVKEGRVLLDLRTVLDEDVEALVAGVLSLARTPGGRP